MMDSETELVSMPRELLSELLVCAEAAGESRDDTINRALTNYLDDTRESSYRARLYEIDTAIAGLDKERRDVLRRMREF